LQILLHLARRCHAVKLTLRPPRSILPN
jgi:hypothetical protein